MERRKLTESQARALSGNRNVARVGHASVMYARTFKQEAMRLYGEGGLSAVEIFRNAGIDLEAIGKRTPNRLMNQWRKALRAGPERLADPLGHPNNNLEMLRTQVAYLKAENHFLAQARARKGRRP
jgi:transposase-like protein